MRGTGPRGTLQVSLVLLMLFIAACGVNGSVGDDDATRRFLFSFRGGFNGLSRVWTGDDICSWPGVVCDAERNEAHLLIVGMDLNGRIPQFSGDFVPEVVRVASINLMGNAKVTGAFPAHWGQLRHLRSIILNGTGLAGTIPNTWNRLSNLNLLDVGNTRACGGLPDWDASVMKSLQFVGFAGNPSMRGMLSRSFGSFSSRIFQLELAGSDFCGCVPDTWVGESLQMAASALPKVTDANCDTANKCSANSMRCGDAAFVTGWSPLWLAVVMLAAVYLSV